jgi:hypothetical protein
VIYCQGPEWKPIVVHTNETQINAFSATLDTVEEQIICAFAELHSHSIYLIAISSKPNVEARGLPLGRCVQKGTLLFPPIASGHSASFQYGCYVFAISIVL